MKKHKIPFYGIERFYKKNKNKILELSDFIFSSGQYLKGNAIVEFENEIAKYCNRKYALTVNNGTDALYFSLKSIKTNKNDEVLVTAFSFISSATCILRAGLIPVFVDIHPDTFQIDFNDLENKITNKTKAILAVNIFGQTLNYDTLYKIAEKNKIAIIEDAAQSIGSTYKNKKSGSFGLTSCFSFDPTKVIGAFGTGGCILTDNETVYDYINSLRNNGKNTIGEYEILGYNSQISSLQAKLLTWQLKNLDKLIDKRIRTAEIYTSNLKEVEQISLPKNPVNQKQNYHKYVIKAENRNKLKDLLDSAGIQTMIHYAKPIPENLVFNNYIHKANNLKTTYSLSVQVLSLPIYQELEENEIVYICNKIKEFYKK